jgi:hypothetical protein
MAGSAPVWLEELRSFIVRAKAATYVTGREWISRAGRRIYVLDYHGGLIRD